MGLALFCWGLNLLFLVDALTVRLILQRAAISCRGLLPIAKKKPVAPRRGRQAF